MAALTGDEPISAANLKAALAPIYERLDALESGGGGGFPH